MLLVPAFFLAARHNNARGPASDLRDAVASGAAVEQLQNSAPPDQDLNGPSPEPPEPAAAPGAGGGAPETTRIFSENDPLHKRLAGALGLDYPCYIEGKHLGRQSQLTEKLTLDDGRRKETVVVKRFGSDTLRASLLGYLMKLERIVSKSAIKYEHDARKLFHNGVAMAERFQNAGLDTLEIVLADPENRILVTKFAKGTDLATVLRAALRNDADALRLIKNLGAALGAAHRSDLVVGDLNTGNVLFMDGKPRFIDLDQGSVGGGKGWDLILPFSYAIVLDRMAAEPDAWALVTGTFLRGYLAGGGGVDNIKDALSLKYSVSSYPPVAARGRDAVRSINAVRHEMKKVIRRAERAADETPI